MPRWLLFFDYEASTWWANLIALGRRKHVRAATRDPELDVWLFYDVALAGTTIEVAAGPKAERLLRHWADGADVLMIEIAKSRRSFFPRFVPILCTTAIAHLVGLPGIALRPDAFYRRCLEAGAVKVDSHDEEPAAAQSAA